MSYVKEQLLKSKQVLDDLLNDNNMLKILEQISEVCVHAINNGNKVMFAGNGGSAADAKHFATELTVKFEKVRKPLPCLPLTADTTAITAIGNDFDFKYIYSRQIEALYNKNDIVIAYSTSGNSLNILEALKFCKKKKIFSITMLGNKGGKCKNYGNLELIINSKKVSRVQEMHYFINHYICFQLDKFF